MHQKIENSMRVQRKLCVLFINELVVWLEFVTGLSSPGVSYMVTNIFYRFQSCCRVASQVTHGEKKVVLQVPWCVEFISALWWVSGEQ